MPNKWKAFKRCSNWTPRKWRQIKRVGRRGLRPPPRVALCAARESADAAFERRRPDQRPEGAVVGIGRELIAREASILVLGMGDPPHIGALATFASSRATASTLPLTSQCWGEGLAETKQRRAMVAAMLMGGSPADGVG